MCTVPVVLLFCTVFIWPSAAQDCESSCLATGHSCTQLGCVCPANNYKKCNTGLHCDTSAGCVDPATKCVNPATGNGRYCTPFENCVSGSCRCGANKWCAATEVCFNNKCYCGNIECRTGETCVDGECRCGGIIKCSGKEKCVEIDNVHQCGCGPDGVETVCIADSECDGNACACEMIGGVPTPCSAGVCINKTCVDGTGKCYDRDRTCSAKIASCSNSALFSYMKENCRQTCGYCDGCADDRTLPPNECNRTASLCYDKDYMPLMTQLCSKTCELCEEKCKDVLDDCKDYPTYCLDTDLSIRTFMGKNCRQSCRYCTNSTACLDVDKDFCEANPIICYHPTFSALASIECPKTCSKC